MQNKLTTRSSTRLLPQQNTAYCSAAHCSALTFEDTLICAVWKYLYTKTKPGRKHKNINTSSFEGMIVLASYMTNIKYNS